MATSVISKSYTDLATITADFQSYFSWDEVDTSVSNQTTFKKTTDSTTGAYVYLRITYVSSRYLYCVAGTYTGTSEYLTTSPTATGSDLVHTKTVVNTDGFVMMFSGVEFPSVISKTTIVGIYKSSNVVDGGTGFSTFMVKTGTILNVFGKNAINNNSFTRPTTASAQMVMATPIASPHSQDVPTGPFFMDYMTGTLVGEMQEVMFNNVHYVRFGNILVPRES